MHMTSCAEDDVHPYQKGVNSRVVDCTVYTQLITIKTYVKIGGCYDY